MSEVLIDSRFRLFGRTTRLPLCAVIATVFMLVALRSIVAGPRHHSWIQPTTR